MNELDKLTHRAHQLLDRLETLLPERRAVPQWEDALAFRWRKNGARGALFPVKLLHPIRLDDLLGIAQQKESIAQNTRQFVRGLPANNVLLTGARGTGKSSLVKALLNEYAGDGLRLIEVAKHDLSDLPDIVETVAERTERFILYCDDLSFAAEEPGYQALKATLDGSVTALSDNLLIYATSNRRHLMPEYLAENLDAKHVGEEVHPGEGVEEKISLSERFGLWLSFYPFNQDEYLAIAEHWLRHFGVAEFSVEARRNALQWALARGSRSGRVACQFARDWAGRQGLGRNT